MISIVGETRTSSQNLEVDMRQENEGKYREIDEYRKPSLIGALIWVAIGYVLAKNWPDIVRYIRISRM